MKVQHRKTKENSHYVYNALTHLLYNSEVVYTSLLRVLCTMTFVDVFNRLIKLETFFIIHVEQRSTLTNIKLALHRVWRLCKILKVSLNETTVFCPGFQKGRVPSEKGTLAR